MNYFKSVTPPKGPIHDVFAQLEDVLQQEHGADGRHPVASASNSGFMSADDKQKLDKIYDWIVKQQEAQVP